MNELRAEAFRLSDDLMALYGEAQELLDADPRFTNPATTERLRDILAQSAEIGARQDAVDEQLAYARWKQ